ncbi:MAG: hypothetical protein NTZ42_04255 [Candidatus Gribaldobacteria bacterium]|nr:hypothetical protein [Candidatus Gribaldobacteria bacterium]
MTMTKKITKDTTLENILELAGADAVLAKYKVPCLTCPMAQYEMQSLTIGDVCKMYGLELAKLLVELNKLAK